ncbi:MAG: hypothetical protein GF388_11415, partial [Candidatus Aegiribacteria sp.]|nr:hypothetical protein [Candidatus Aegiribacteria sp.]MBD3295601.1 hypothetical protein [Candidatus Fermentibacteria bacterium]
QFRNRKCVEVLDARTFIVLSRLDAYNSQLDVYHKEEEWKPVCSLPTHSLDHMCYLHRSRLVILSFELMPVEKSVALFLRLTDDLRLVVVDTVEATVRNGWCSQNESYIETREGLTYRLGNLAGTEDETADSIRCVLPEAEGRAMLNVIVSGDPGMNYGYVNKEGNTVIRPRFSSAQGFESGSAVVGLTPHGFQGVVNKEGDYLMPCHASWIGPLSEGCRRVAFAGFPSAGKEPEQGLFGLLRKDGEWLLKPDYSVVRNMSEGRAAVSFGNGDENWITAEGRRLSEDGYQVAGDFSQGLASAMKDDLNCYVDTMGKPAIDRRFRVALPFSEGAAGVQLQSGFWCFIDLFGKKLGKDQFDEVFSHSCGFASVRRGNGWGYVDEKGLQASDMDFERTYNFVSGLGVVVREGLWNFLTSEGKLASPKGWEGTYLPAEGMGAFKSGGLFGYVNARGDVAVEPRFPSAYAYCEGLSAVLQDELWGYIDKSGEWAIEPRFAAVRNFREGLAPARVTADGPWGYIDTNGDFVLPPAFNEAYLFSSGMAVVGFPSGSGQPERRFN